MLTGATHRCAVVGHPVAHSLSPLLHRAAYAALGLCGWTYDRCDVRPGGLTAYLRSLTDDWVGLSVTMPLKEEALALGTEVEETAGLTGAANTLVRRGGGWLAANTDVDGLTRALQDELGGRPQPTSASVLGGGATARSALVALSRLGVREAALWVRDLPRPGTSELAERLGLSVKVRRLADGIRLADAGELVVSTLPGTAPAPDVSVTEGAGPSVLLDVAYDPWPSPFADAVAAAGRPGAVARGTGMLLHQAARQVELMTGHEAPVPAMRDALAGQLEAEETGGVQR